MKKNSVELAEPEISLEEAFAKLDETISALETEDITLEDSFRRYKEGMDLLKICSDTIDKVEKKVQLINDEGEVHEF